MAIRWSITVKHEGLGKYRVISGTDKSLVEAKARAQELEWERKFQKILADSRQKRNVKGAVHEAKERARRELEEKLQDAEEKTGEAQQNIQAVSVASNSIFAKCRALSPPAA
jgi:restriction system protein